MLQRLKGKKVRIRPVPYKHTSIDKISLNEFWVVENATDDFLEISYPATGHSKRIGKDHVKEFMTDTQFGSDGILVLKSQIIIDGRAVHIEPII